ncbi:MAG: hypothetical protein E6I75_05145 [Chloroflexi bacterium]|nr:MAG: hypothetical protein E6I75_05145 [Chloroflexota bacterium]
MVDQPPPVGGEIAGVEVVVIGVPLQVGAVGGATVDVAVTLVIGQEKDAPIDPARAGEVALESDQGSEFA